jgi:hypothetical protein
VPSFYLVHRVTGMPLQGYQVKEAAASDIAEANSKLAAAGSEFRYLPIQQLSERTTTGDLDVPGDAAHPS